MNTLRNIFSIRTFNILRQHGQNAFINSTQQQQPPPIDSINGPTTKDLKRNVTSIHEVFNSKLNHTEGLFIPKTTIDETHRFSGKNFVPNSTIHPTTVTGNKNGSVSPRTLKLYRRVQRKVDIIYTCKLCNTRNSKQVNEAAYTNGVVILQCDGCFTNHLIIDNLGWFTAVNSNKSFNDILTENSKSIKVIKVNENGEFI